MGIEQLLPTGSVLLIWIVSLVGMWFRFQNKIERLTDDQDEFKRQIAAFWRWKDEHEKWAASQKESMMKDIARLDASHLVVNEQFKQIMAMLQEIKERIDRLENLNGKH